MLRVRPNVSQLARRRSTKQKHLYFLQTRSAWPRVGALSRCSSLFERLGSLHHFAIRSLRISNPVIEGTRISCTSTCGTETFRLCSQTMSKKCTCSTFLNSSTIPRNSWHLHTLLVDPLRAFLWDEPHVNDHVSSLWNRQLHKLFGGL